MHQQADDHFPQGLFAGPAVWPAGSYLFEQGEAANTVFWLQDGFVKLLYSNAAGSEIMVDVKRAPALLGATAALSGRPHAVTAVIGQPSRALFCLSRELVRAVHSDPQCGRVMMRILVDRHDELIARIAAVAGNTTEERLIQLLRKFSDIPPGTAPADTTKLSLPLKQSEVAAYLWVTPEHLSRITANLARRGVLSLKRDWLMRNVSKLRPASVKARIDTCQERETSDINNAPRVIKGGAPRFR